MIKLTICVRRLSTLSLSEFQSYWFEQHSELVRQHAASLRIRRYIQSHTFSDTRLAPAMEGRGGPDAFDGVAQLWWDSVEDMQEAGASPEGRLADQALRSDEATFIDLANSVIFFSSEREII